MGMKNAKRALLATVATLAFTVVLSGTALADEPDAGAVSVSEDMEPAALVTGDIAASDVEGTEAGASDVTDPVLEGSDTQNGFADEEAATTAADAAVAPDAVTSAEETDSEALEIEPSEAHPDGWSSEGGTTYYWRDGVPFTGWVIDDHLGNGLQRFWVADGVLATSRLVDPAEGSGYWAYARPEGYVVRGKWTAADGNVYLADNDGRLENPGWLVTGAYDGGLQRYWIDETARACVPGYSEDGYKHYTTAKGYVLRGAGNGYFADNGGRLAEGWLCTDAFGQKLQRYWMVDGKPVKDRLIDPAEGSGYWAYARPEGYVVRGKWDDGKGHVYLADNGGRLENADGWLVTDKYDGGLQRYWMDGEAHAAVTGFFEVEGYGKCYGLPGQGYLLRGAGNGYFADNGGRLANGWVCTDAFGQKLQRYWMVDGKPARDRLIDPAEGSGYWAYARPEGYVVRGKWDDGRGHVYLADNGGRLENADGWLVTDKYDGGLQRYWMDGETHAAVSGFFTVEGYGRCFGVGGKGYVLRGKGTWGNHVLLADNGGRLCERSGWMVTGTYDNGRLQRYWMEPAFGDYLGARTGMFNQGGSKYYGEPEKGYVFRTGYIAISGVAYHADTGGRLTRITGVGISRVLGIDAAVYLAWLMSHEHDSYYRGTVYRSGDWRSPHGDISYNGAEGTNCTGFVWHTYVGAGANPYSVPHLAGCGYCAGGWGVILNNPAVPQYYFSTKEEMLASGVLSKGDVIWVWDDDHGGRSASVSTNHIGIFWGDTPSQDRFWHAPSYGNVIGTISSGANHKSYTVLKL